MAFYRRHILPRLTHVAMSAHVIAAERARCIPLAAGYRGIARKAA